MLALAILWFVCFVVWFLGFSRWASKAAAWTLAIAGAVFVVEAHSDHSHWSLAAFIVLWNTMVGLMLLADMPIAKRFRRLGVGRLETPIGALDQHDDDFIRERSRKL